MAIYNEISSIEKDADSPITVSLINKLDQNPLAMWEGASGAPKISNSAIQSGSIGQDRVSKSRTVFTPGISGASINSSDCFYIRNGGLVYVHLNVNVTATLATITLVLPFDFKDTDGSMCGSFLTPGNELERPLPGIIRTKPTNSLSITRSSRWDSFSDVFNYETFGSIMAVVTLAID